MMVVSPTKDWGCAGLGTAQTSNKAAGSWSGAAGHLGTADLAYGKSLLPAEKAGTQFLHSDEMQTEVLARCPGRGTSPLCVSPLRL